MSGNIIKVGIAQIAPVWLNRDQTLKKILSYTESAGNEGGGRWLLSEKHCFPVIPSGLNKPMVLGSIPEFKRICMPTIWISPSILMPVIWTLFVKRHQKAISRFFWVVLMRLLTGSLYAQGEDLHVALWPGVLELRLNRTRQTAIKISESVDK
ncbi:MAG: hypothetical protein KKC20_10645 [Proteobacteria bacterium]|nr:hypothetical protein [Pseudomonadota bacterium]